MRTSNSPTVARSRLRPQCSSQPAWLPDVFDDAAARPRARRAPTAERVRPVASTESIQASGLVSLHGVHVMVVEDNPDARDIIRRVLEHCGAAVTVVESAPAALRRLRALAGRPHVLVSDLALPGDDGYALIRQVRAVERLRTLPALAITAHRNEYDREATLAAGFQDYLQKPLDLGSFARAVARLAGL